MNRFDADYEEALRKANETLTGEFAGTYSRETIERYLRETSDQLRQSRVPGYVPLLMERLTRDRLRSLGPVEDLMQKTNPEVLFVCLQNAGRSQMAAALTDALSGGRVHVRSAGSEPAAYIHSTVQAAMGELGLDLSKEFPKPLTDDFVEAADVVITMGCGDACPIFPGKRYLDWEVDDPAGQPLERVRIIRDEIGRRVETLLIELNVPVTRPWPASGVAHRRD